jgi:hypothetical protein
LALSNEITPMQVFRASLARPSFSPKVHISAASNAQAP